MILLCLMVMKCLDHHMMVTVMLMVIVMLMYDNGNVWKWRGGLMRDFGKGNHYKWGSLWHTVL